ncbi:probable proteasome inhibitor [Zingiber officinale]|uniref:probable proteasome inhibitor n=1 Tax=Zingiber officinale TaxID=94328 RepID=UPI001C4DA57D|nr:probable proteasome inhibitor [Zingiber officinale]
MASDSSVMAVIRASRPSFRNDHDKVVFAVHASFLAAGFSLVATGARALSENPPTDGEEVGIDGWNEPEDAYAFVYTKTVNGSKKIVSVKCLPIGDELAVDVLDLNEQKKEPLNLQIDIKEYVSDVADQSSNYSKMYKNLKGLVDNLGAGLLAKLEPKFESSSSALSADKRRRDTTSEPSLIIAGQQEPYDPGLVYPPIPASGISDIYPSPGAGFFPHRGSGIGGGMLVGPNDPRFFGSDERPGFIGGLPGVPPGARYDPYGPPGVPGFEPARFIRQPRRPGGGTHPDLEHFQGPDYI